ncbi:MAG TPA: heme ABC exporter ATP-binding protein CcmA [Gemmatimonadaceae bacterium]|nr:heme ABC exporter ATP-binding protein CcmA [Gemmatimonadaceae bacterium]
MSLQGTTEITSLLDAVGLTRSFDTRRAVDGVSFRLALGECLALFGPNGAGKTTLLKMLAGLIRPTAGRALLNGVPLGADASSRAQLGFISHHTMLYSALSARENVTFAARLYGVANVDAEVESSLHRMSMLDRADTPVRLLSRGMQQRVSIARAMVHRPKLVLADEPFNGLDDNGASALTTLLRELRAGGTLLVIVTHNIAEGLALATRAAVMNRGKFVIEEPAVAADAVSFMRRYRDAIANG